MRRLRVIDAEAKINATLERKLIPLHARQKRGGG